MVLVLVLRAQVLTFGIGIGIGIAIPDVNVLETQRLGNFDIDKKNKKHACNVWTCPGRQKSHRKILRKKSFLTENSVITAELSPKDLTSEKQLLARRCESTRSGIDLSRLEMKKRKFYEDGDFLEVK